MFGKKKNIEDDFLAYGSQSQSQKNSDGKSVLGNLIQFLIVVVLMGVVALMGIFGYRYLQNDTDKNPAFAGTTLPDTAQSALPVPAVPAVAAGQSGGKQKMYTQEEMQAIVKMLMEQMQGTGASAPAGERTVSSAQNASASEGEENPDALVAALDIAEADDMQDLEPALPENMDGTKMGQVKSAKNAQKVDHYNKVVVQKSKNTYDDLANLSQEIGTIVDDMKTKKKPESSYTSSIKKEVSVRSSEMRVIIVKEGDSLSRIAKRAYGSAQAYDRILEANPDLIKNPNNIYIGQRLRVPVNEY